MDDELRRQEAEPVAPLPCPFCAEALDPASDGWEHPASDSCPLDSLFILHRHVDGWNRRAVTEDAAPAVPVTTLAVLIERLEHGVCPSGMHEDNSTELYMVDDANDTMAEAAAALRAQQPAPQVKAVPWKVWDKLCHLFAETLAHVDEGIIHDESREAFFALKNEAHTALSGEAQPAQKDKDE